MNRNYELKHHLAVAAVIGAILALTSCDKQTSTGETVGQRVDKAIDKTNETAQKAGEKISEAAKSTGAAIEDSMITASIKAELMKEPSVSALKIDVDTVKGEVTLKGEADSDAARERAERIATAVAGVVKVNNAISVKPKG